jgi:DNA-binding MarR family transcriptional regulator
MVTEVPGYEIAFLLMGAFRRILDDLHAELAIRGFPEARPVHGFALQAIGPGAVTITELGRRLGVSKQAAAKTVKALEMLGYVTREADPADARASFVRRGARGNAMLRTSAAVFEQQKRHWVDLLGEDRFAALIVDMRLLGGGTPVGDIAAWLQ